MNRKMKFTLIGIAMALSHLSAMATTASDIIAKAPTMVIALDNSGSSPALSDVIVQAAWPEIEQAIKKLPLGAEVKIFTMGDASAPYVSTPGLRIQKKLTASGGSHDYVIDQVKRNVVGFPAQVRKGNIAEHGISELIGGFHDAAKLLNKNSQENQVFAISDLVENSTHANCYRDLKCKLPKPTFKMHSAKITVIGVGTGLNATRAMDVSKSWYDFFKATGATVSTQDLRRVN
jgi:hypothetical protein